MDYEDISHPPQSTLENNLIQKVSGIVPAQTGPVCDVCGTPFETDSDESDYAYVYADWDANDPHSPGWLLKSPYCEAHKDQLDNRPLVEAVVKCELMYRNPSTGRYTLGNPKIHQMNTSNGAVIR